MSDSQNISMNQMCVLFEVSRMTMGRWIKEGVVKDSVTKLPNGTYLFNKELAIKEHNQNKSSKMILQGGDKIGDAKQKNAPISKERNEDNDLQDATMLQDEASLQELSLVQIEKRDKIKALLLKDRELQLKEIKIQEAAGLLIDKREANDALYTVATALKNRIFAIPNKCIDSLRAAKTRTEALEILTKQLEKVLINLEEDLLNEL